MSVDNTPASAADKSSSAEDTTISTSAVVKSSSAEDAPISASAADKSSSAEDMPIKFPEKEHSALDGDKGPSSESGNSPLALRKSSRACPPWGDMDEPEDEEMKSSDPPKVDGEDSPLPALHAENTLANNRAGLLPASERHKFKAPSSSPKINARHGEYDSTDEDDSSPTSAVETVKEVIRKGGSPLDNLQWSSQLAKNLAEGERNTKSPPGTPQSLELEEEEALLKPTHFKQ